MAPVIDAWFVLVVSIASRMNREQDKALQYLMAENRVLKDQLKKRGKRIQFTDKQRHLLATKAKELGRAALKNIDTVYPRGGEREDHPTQASATRTTPQWLL